MAGLIKIKLQNARTGKKENLPGEGGLGLYLPLQTGWVSGGDPPTLGQFSSLTQLRLFFLGDLLARIFKLENRTFEVVSKPEMANILIFGDPLVNQESDSGKTKKQIILIMGGVFFKSEGNHEGLEVTRNFSREEIQYLTYGTHYTQPLQISQASLDNSRAALKRLKEYITGLEEEIKGENAFPAKNADLEIWQERFYSQINEDLNLPRAVSILWTLLQSNTGAGGKLKLIEDFDRILNLRLITKSPGLNPTPVIKDNYPLENPNAAVLDKTPDTLKKIKARNSGESLVSGFYRDEKSRPETAGKNAESGRSGGKNKKENRKKEEPKKGNLLGGSLKQKGQKFSPRGPVENSQQVRSLLGEPDRFDLTVSLLAHENLAELRATVESLLFYSAHGPSRVEVLAVDLGSQDGSPEYLDGVAASYANFRVILASKSLGEAAGRNLTIRQARGKYLLFLEAGLTLKGNLMEALLAQVGKQEPPTLYGLFPLKLIRVGNKPAGFEGYSLDPKEGSVPVEALEGSLLFFRRDLVEEAGFMDEGFRTPYALDLDYSFAFKDKGFKVLALPSLANLVNKPAGFSPAGYNLNSQDQAYQQEKNWKLFVKSWNFN